MVDISLLVTKITFVVANIFCKEAVITSSAVKITFVVTDILFLLVDICLQILDQMIAKKQFHFYTDSCQTYAIKAQERLIEDLTVSQTIFKE